ncbi:MAG: PulJ/GspJ family protein [Acidimicrobiales bacterium]
MSERGASEAGFSLLEMVVVCAVLGLVLAIGFQFVVSANSSVNVATYRAANNADAGAALASLSQDLRYASGVGYVTSGANEILYVNNANADPNPTSDYSTIQPACAQWQVAGGALEESVNNGPWQAIVQGVTPTIQSGTQVTFAGNPGYNGLLSVHFDLNGHPSVTGSGVEVVDSLVATNMGGPIQPGTTEGC